MFIRSLEIKDNVRLMIRGTKHLKVDFNEIHQVILGSNGSGKSTLMNELSPLPSFGGDYFKDGYKIIVIEHNGLVYKLSSVFSNKAGVHSFVNETTGEELNPGGTQSVQRELVEDIFKYTDDLHAIMIDKVKFTDMSPLLRRQWLTRMSGTNLDYAINLFNQLKKRQRDEEGVVKHLANRLNKESADVVSEENIAILTKRTNEIKDKIKELYEHRVYEHLKLPTNYLENIDFLVKRAIDECKALLRVPDDLAVLGCKSYNDVLLKKQELVTKELSNKERLDSLFREHGEITNLFKTIEGITSEEDYNRLVEELSTLEKEIDKKRDKLKHIKQADDVISLAGFARGISNEICETLKDMIDNTEGYITTPKLTEANDKLEALNNQINGLQNQLKNAEHRLHHLNSVEDVNCPQCNNVFKPNINPTELPRVTKFIEETTAKINSLNEEKEKVVAYINEAEIYRVQYKRVNQLMATNIELDCIWNTVKPLMLNENHANYYITKITECVRDLELLSSIEVDHADLMKKSSLCASYKVSKVNEDMHKQRLDTINKNITELQYENSKLKENINLLDRVIHDHDTMMSHKATLLGTLGDLNQEITNFWTSLKKSVVDNLIDDENLKLANISASLNESLNIQNIIADITREHKESIERNANYKILLEEFNPTTGLIADFFKYFIIQFVEQMNIVISKVWEHDIEILPCDVDKDGITYKFPLRINGREYGPTDVSKGSNSQITISNFAFKIVLMIYLGMENYPLYLDELAPDLDEKHRINIVRFVRDYVESNRCSQMFMVSHYETGYGAFYNAEVLVLDDENLLEIPKNSNTHCVVVKDTPTEIKSCT